MTTPIAPRPTALVTGASSGIGLALARVLAAAGHDLVLVARREDRLSALAAAVSRDHGVGAVTVVVDLAHRDGPARVVARVAAEGLDIDVLVNNAGVGRYGPFAESSLDAVLDMIQVNVTSLTALTRLLLPGMIARRRGRVLNVASTAAFQPGPLMAVYYASKAYVLSFSEALASELAGTGVTVTALCPGPTGTEFQAAARLEKSRLVRFAPMTSPAKVAEAGVKALLAGRPLVVPGLVNRLGVLGAKWMPRRLVTAIVKRAQQPTRRSRDGP